MSSLLSQQVIDFLQSQPRFRADTELRLIVDDQAVGWVSPKVAEALLALAPAQIQRTYVDQSLSIGTDGDYLRRSQTMQSLAIMLREQKLLLNWRDEAMQFELDGEPFMQLERAAFRTFGLCAPAVHLNGWVITAEGAALWVAQRSPHKFVDPGKLDNLVGGGLAAGESIAFGLAREAWEEAGLHFRRMPCPSSTLYIHRRIPEGVQEERIAVHDIWLSAHFQAMNQDGEVAGARLLPIAEVMPLLLAGHFTWDAGLVVIDGLLRQRYFGAGTALIEATLTELGYRE